MTIFRFERIPDILMVAGALMCGWKMVTSVPRAFRIEGHPAIYRHASPDRDHLIKIRATSYYVTAADAAAEKATFPVLACGAFLFLIGRKMKSA